MKTLAQFTSFRFVVGFSLTLACSALTWGAFSWASYTKMLSVKSILVTGSKIIPASDYTNSLQDLIGLPVSQLHNKTIAERLETSPYVQAARVSIHFPDVLSVELVEREPIAMINMDPIMFIDQYSVVLPNNSTVIEMNIPILSGFNETKNLFPVGKPTLSSKIRETTKIIVRIQNLNPTLYKNISEIRLNHQDEYELILLEKPTKVLLGLKNISKKIHILKEFGLSLSQKRHLTDFSTIDLRYNNQVIVRERKR